MDVPIIQTDLEIKPVRIGAWADIGVNAVILPGVTIGQGCHRRRRRRRDSDVRAFSIVAWSAGQGSRAPATNVSKGRRLVK